MMMRIGVVCEGPTDFHAIKSFFGHSLTRQQVQPEFVDIQPILDATQPNGGWANVLSWLQDNPPGYRIPKYLIGPFADDLSSQPLDCLLIHLDSDVLGNKSFESHLKKQHQYTAKNPGAPAERAEEIQSIIAHVGQFSAMTKADGDRHIPAPAVESTETWCVAAFTKRKQNFESLSGQQLINAFMSALERSEGKQPETSYGREANKDVPRRKKYCEQFAKQSERIINGCPQFKQIHQDLLGLVPS